MHANKIDTMEETLGAMIGLTNGAMTKATTSAAAALPRAKAMEMAAMATTAASTISSSSSPWLTALCRPPVPNIYCRWEPRSRRYYIGGWYYFIGLFQEDRHHDNNSRKTEGQMKTAEQLSLILGLDFSVLFSPRTNPNINVVTTLRNFTVNKPTPIIVGDIHHVGRETFTDDDGNKRNCMKIGGFLLLGTVTDRVLNSLLEYFERLGFVIDDEFYEEEEDEDFIEESRDSKYSKEDKEDSDYEYDDANEISLDHNNEDVLDIFAKCCSCPCCTGNAEHCSCPSCNRGVSNSDNIDVIDLLDSSDDE
jgi:hypothetical protein